MGALADEHAHTLRRRSHRVAPPPSAVGANLPVGGMVYAICTRGRIRPGAAAGDRAFVPNADEY